MGEVPSQHPLLTDEELRAKLLSSLKTGFVEHGNIYVPTTTLYNKLHTNEGLREVFTELCRWLGVKPGHTTVQFSTSEQTHSPLYKNQVVIIDHAFRNNPYITGSLLAFAALLYYFDKYDTRGVDDDFVEFASIETGLGLWVINGLKPKSKHHQRLYHIMKGMWVHKDGVHLHRYTPELYAHNVASYAHNNHILAEDYVPGVSSAHRYLLPEAVTRLSGRALPEPAAITAHKKTARQLWLRYIVAAAIVASITVCGVYLWSTRYPAVSAQQLEDQKALAIIKNSLDACVQKVSDQQSTYNPNDLFMDRQIDSTKSRCQTLRNEYNYALNQYQTLYNNP